MEQVIEVKKDWEILSFKGKSFKPKSVRRTTDGVVFSIGDMVTNDPENPKGMKGAIIGFEPDDTVNGDGSGLWVSHTWSGVGMNLASLSHVVEKKKDIKTNTLPAAFQPEDFCCVQFGEGTTKFGGQVVKVSFSRSKVLYDIEIGVGKDVVTRLYNVDSAFVSKVG